MLEITIPTSHKEQLIDITRDVQDAISQAGWQNGLCFVHTIHTTAGLTINENADPDVKTDILASLNSIVKDLAEFRHAEGNSSAHVKSTLTGTSVNMPLQNGQLILGVWQGIYFCEFDGPRVRHIKINCCPGI